MSVAPPRRKDRVPPLSLKPLAASPPLATVPTSGGTLPQIPQPPQTASTNSSRCSGRRVPAATFPAIAYGKQQFHNSIGTAPPSTPYPHTARVGPSPFFLKHRPGAMLSTVQQNELYWHSGDGSRWTLSRSATNTSERPPTSNAAFLYPQRVESTQRIETYTSDTHQTKEKEEDTNGKKNEVYDFFMEDVMTARALQPSRCSNCELSPRMGPPPRPPTQQERHFEAAERFRARKREELARANENGALDKRGRFFIMGDAVVQEDGRYVSEATQMFENNYSPRLMYQESQIPTPKTSSKLEQNELIKKLFLQKLTHSCDLSKILLQFSQKKLKAAFSQTTQRYGIRHMGIDDFHVVASEVVSRLTAVEGESKTDVNFSESKILFDFFDSNRNGVLDVEELLDGLSLLLLDSSQLVLINLRNIIVDSRNYKELGLSCFEVAMLLRALLSFYRYASDIDDEIFFHPPQKGTPESEFPVNDKDPILVAEVEKVMRVVWNAAHHNRITVPLFRTIVQTRGPFLFEAIIAIPSELNDFVENFLSVKKRPSRMIVEGLIQIDEKQARELLSNGHSQMAQDLANYMKFCKPAEPANADAVQNSQQRLRFTVQKCLACSGKPASPPEVSPTAHSPAHFKAKPVVHTGAKRAAKKKKENTPRRMVVQVVEPAPPQPQTCSKHVQMEEDSDEAVSIEPNAAALSGEKAVNALLALAGAEHGDITNPRFRADTCKVEDIKQQLEAEEHYHPQWWMRSEQIWQKDDLNAPHPYFGDMGSP